MELTCLVTSIAISLGGGRIGLDVGTLKTQIIVYSPFLA